MVFQIPQHAIGDSLGYKFRGAWNAPEPIFVEDFSGGGLLPTWMSVRDNGSSTLSLASMATSNSEPRPDLPWVWRVTDAGTYSGSDRLGFQIDLDALTVIAGREGELLEVQVASWLPSGTTQQTAELHLDSELRLSVSSDVVRNGPWHKFQIPLQGHSIADAVYNFYTGSTPLNVELASVILYAKIVDYEFGDIVAHDDDFWRCAKAGTLAEPGRSSHWQKIPSSIITKTLLLRDIRNVDLTGLYDKAVLTYHHEDQKWHPGDKTEDQRNFRGDWQNTADTLLWSTDFSDPDDLEEFTITSGGTTNKGIASTESVSGIVSGDSGYSWCYQAIPTTGSGWYIRINLPLGTILPGVFVSRVEYTYGWRLSQGNDRGNLYINGVGVNTTTSGRGVSPWETGVSEINAVDATQRWWLDRTNPGGSGSASGALAITGIEVYGVVSNDDLYQLGDVVYHDGSYWRSLYNLNTDEPSEESVKWEKIGDIFASRINALSALTDVDLTGKYDGAMLKFDEEQQVWRPGQYAPDYRNFRGDWQDPADYLLWSIDFSNPSDLDLFVPSTTGGYDYGSEYTKSLLNAEQVVVPDPIAYPNVARFALKDSGSNSGSALFTLDVAQIPEISGRYISKMKFEEAIRGQASTTTVGTRFINFGGSALFSQFSIPPTGIGWRTQEVIYDSVSFEPAWSLEDYNTGSASGRYTVEYFVTGIQVYGVLDNEDLYRMNDVVSHNGYFWRSLFNLNADEPAEESEKWLKITEFVVDSHKQPQGLGRVEDLPSSTSRSSGGWSQIYQEVTPKEDFWLDKVRFYTGGGGDCTVYVRNLQGNVLRTGTFNTGPTTTTTPEWFEATLDAPLHLTAESSYLVGFVPTTSVNTHRASGLYNGTMWRTRRAMVNGFDWIGGASPYNETHGMGLVEFDSTI